MPMFSGKKKGHTKASRRASQSDEVKAIKTLMDNADLLAARANAEEHDGEFLQVFFQDSGICSLVTAEAALEPSHGSPTPPSVSADSTIDLTKCVFQLLTMSTSDSAVELYEILDQWNMKGLIMSYDDVVNRNYGQSDEIDFSLADELPTGATAATLQRSDPGLNPALYEESYRMVGFERPEGEPLGMTVRIENNLLTVARIMAGSAIDKKQLFRVGDIIREVNGQEVVTPRELMDVISRQRGKLMFKVVPSYMQLAGADKVFVRCHFSWSAQTDSLLPCREAGLSFRYGQILEVLSKDERNWWQARYVESEQSAGIIPSQDLMERRKAWVQPTKDYSKVSLGCGLVRRKKKTFMYDSKLASDFDHCDFKFYEEVVKLPPFERKTLILVGSKGVGRRTLKNMLLETDSIRFGTTMPFTSRPKMDWEIEGRGYLFASREEMEMDINQNQYLEHGEYQGHLYGTKLDTVRQVIRSGKLCVLDVGPQALKLLKNQEFMPFIVFIAAPSAEIVEAMYQYGYRYGFTDKVLGPDDFARTVTESQELEATYKAYFDLILVNDNMQLCFAALLQNLDEMSTEEQWVPTDWVF